MRKKTNDSSGSSILTAVPMCNNDRGGGIRMDYLGK